MKSYIILFILIVVISVRLYAFSSGTGTENDPFLISTADHLNEIRVYLGETHKDKHFKLANDINLIAYSLDLGWEPIGDNINAFCGKLDGNGKHVINLKIDRQQDNVALFAFTNGAVIKNIGLENVQISGGYFVSSLVANNFNNSLIESCKSTGTIYGFNIVGGLVGRNQNSKIQNSYSFCTVLCSRVSGGLVAVNEGTPDTGMIYFAGGTFQMGSAGISTPVHNVTLSSFLIGKYEVSTKEYCSIMGGQSYFEDYLDYHPMIYVNWFHTLVYCNKKSIQEGLTPCYSINGSTNPANWGSIPTNTVTNWNTVVCDWSATGYRLPTEAEWEYAARGGNQSMSYTYSGSNDINEVAWYQGNSSGKTHFIGIKNPNELGIFDMSGNVWEWCWDCVGVYSSSDQTNPTGGPLSFNRIIRGGSSFGTSNFCNVAYRTSQQSYTSSEYRGFRLARSLP